MRGTSRLRFGMAQGALQWLNRLCALYTKHAPAVQSCHAEVHSSGAVVSLTVAGGTVQLLLKPKGEGKSYAETASLAVSLQPRPEDSTLDAREASRSHAVIEVLVRADKGNIDVAPALPPENHGQAERVLIDPEAVAAARAELADEIHWASFVGYKALVTEDLYPHVGPLGEILSEEKILDGWRDAVRRINEGTAPEKLGLYVHTPFCTVACSFCYCGKTDNFNRAMMDGYLDRLHADIDTFAPIFTDSIFTSSTSAAARPRCSRHPR